MYGEELGPTFIPLSTAIAADVLAVERVSVLSPVVILVVSTTN